MELDAYFNPLDKTEFESIKRGRPHFGNLLRLHTPEKGISDLSDIHIALIGIPESRNAPHNAGCELGPDIIRNYLYRLFPPKSPLPMADLGNLKQGNTPEDTYAGLAEVYAYLRNQDIVPIVLGGSHDMTYAMYLGYEKTGININMVNVDPFFDLGEAPEEINHTTWLSKLFLRQPSVLFNYTHLGYQTYFVDSAAVTLMKNMLFDVYRLGQINPNIDNIEPLVRNADLISIDISAVRASDAPGCAYATPNGFFGDQICQITIFAGMSDKVSSLGIFEYNPKYDCNGRTAYLISQMIWYFVEGYLGRLNDFPGINPSLENHFRYFVKIENMEEEIIFYKSKKSDRWWLQVPCPEYLQTKYYRHIIVPCSYQDYQSACNNELPDRYWQFYQKMM